ncbi:MAG: response regulator [Usitatibacteraceae bacterium]
MKVKRLLIVDDSADDVELTTSALKKFHFVNPVDVARDGVEALDYLYCRGHFASREPGNPALILLDIKMPRVGGLAVLKQVRNDPKLNMVPVVMLTSSREERDIVEGYELGANAYVVKPVDFEQFMTAVRDLGMFWLAVNELPSN